MKIQKENIEDKIKLIIDVEARLIADKSEVVYGRLSKNVKVAGFRPGKAPKHLIEKEIGQERLNAEILDLIIPETYYEAITKENLNPVGPPEIKLLKFVPTDGLSYEAVIEVLPEFKLPDLTAIKIKREVPKITDEEIQEVLNDLAKQLAKHSKVTRPAKLGDKIEIDFEGFVDNLPFEGNKNQKYPLILGQGQMIPGFEEQLVGMKENEDKEIEVTFPKEYHATNLASKKAKFKIKMHEINEVILPVINDAFATQVGPFKELSHLKEDIGKELLNTKVAQERNRIEGEILEKIISQTKIKVPSSLIHQETHNLLHEVEHNLEHQGLTVDRYLEMTKKTKEELEKEMLPEAEKRVKIGLILTEVAKKLKAEVTEEEIHQEAEKRLLQVNPEEKKQAESFYDSHDGHHQIENGLIGEKVISYLYETCSK
ncbi:MAG: trigger factor [Patescibacteria group bacterium]|nr:trigger factor [Patescibacteria group bacterium]